MQKSKISFMQKLVYNLNSNVLLKVTNLDEIGPFLQR